tara:strand:+ start:1821 stop:2561 length:741 start_codon:yes stop_codon:yes gene_type:complete
MNILFLLAGSSDSFYKEGFNYPKPIIEINGEMVIKKVIDNYKDLLNKENKVIFIIREEDELSHHLTKIIKLLVPRAEVIKVKKETQGAACTSLLAIDFIENPESLLVVSGDQIIDAEIKEIINFFKKENKDGGLLTFTSVHPRFSYVKLSKKLEVIEASEKTPISKNATAGFYFYKSGKQFVKYTKQMIEKGSEVNGKYYLCPIFNEMILDNKKIISYQIDSQKYHSLMTPDLFKDYKKLMEQKNV